MNKTLENKPWLLDQVRDKRWLNHTDYSYRTEQSYIAGKKQFSLHYFPIGKGGKVTDNAAVSFINKTEVHGKHFTTSFP